MAKKGAAVQLQIEVENEENWELLVDRDGLILVDIYSDWCGPCAGMLGNLRKVKLEIGGDTLTLASAKCNNIPCLNRFVNKSRPTWMFISNRRMIRLMFGADAPRLISTLIEEIKITKKAMTTDTPREGIDFDQLTEEEQAVADEEARIREEKERVEREAREQAINERREEMVENLIEPLKDYNFVMTWPHVGNDGMTQIFNAVKETSMSVAGKPVKYQLTEEDLHEMLYYSTWEYSDIEIQELLKDEVTGLLFQAPSGEEEEQPIDIFLDKFYGVTKCPPGDEESLAVKLSTTIKMKIEEHAPEEEEQVIDTEGEGQVRVSFREPEPQPRLTRKSKKEPISEVSRKSRKSTDPHRKSSAVEEEDFIEVPIPGIYVPENAKCLSLAMRILFPNVTQKYDLPEPEPIPPHLICAFDTSKRADVLQLASEWPEGTMRFGFFTSADPETAQLIVKTGNQFNNIHVPPRDAKLIVQISKKTSEPLLSYSLLGPTYISPDCDVGERECELLFPEGYDEPESEPESTEEESKKKKKRDSETSIGSDELGSEGGSEEGLEEVEEEEEEEDDTDDIGFDLAGYEEPADLVAPSPVAAEEAPAE